MSDVADKQPPMPMFIIGGDDRPSDTRVVGVSLGVRAEMKVADREFSAPICLHEVVVMRHYYDVKAGSGSIRLSASWPPGLKRERPLIHADLVAEVKRMRETYLVAKANSQVIRSFEMFFGSEPTEQLKRLHAVLRDQYEAWKALLAKARGRLPADAATLHPEVQRSMACDLINEREIEEIALLADPGRAGLDSIELPAMSIETTPAPSATTALHPATLDEIRAAAEAEADAQVEPATRGEVALAALTAAGFDHDRGLGVAALVDQYGDEIKDADLLHACGTKAKVEQAKAILAKLKKG